MRVLRGALDELGVDLKSIPILYDGEAIFSSRDILRCAVEGRTLSTSEQQRMLDDEMALARAAAHVTAVNESDADTFRAAGCRSVSVLGDGFQATATPKPFAERRDLLFVGALDDDPSPNTDALIWFVANVVPLVKARLIVAGRCAVPRVRALAGRDVELLGMVDNLDPLYNAARVFVAPHRYAAGIPNKVLEAAAAGVPCVISELLAEQLGWREGVEVLTSSTPESYARAILQIYSDEVLWQSLRRSALTTIGRQFSAGAFRDRVSAAIHATLSS
jgi:glycosyltransferase involved in cell wall biosynthesis